MQITNVTLTDVIAIWGGLTGSIGLWVSVLSYRRDKADIRLSYQQNMIVGEPAHPYDSDKTYMALKVVNRGRRPIKIMNAGYQYLKKNGGALLGDGLRKGVTKLEEGDYDMYLIDQESIDFNEINYFTVSDAIGNSYKLYIAPLYKRLWYNILHKTHLKRKPDVIFKAKK